MTDPQIIALYLQRKEEAIQASMEAYGSYCRAIAGRILPDQSDAEEVVADTWFQAWNAIPPQRPGNLRLFLGKITRNLALSIWRKNNALSRGGGQVQLALEELGDCICPEASPEALISTKELAASISSFLRALPERQRGIFLRRYFYMEDIRTVADHFGMKEANVRMLLSRLRQRLKMHLLQEGYL